jgi:hypothetical protein
MDGENGLLTATMKLRKSKVLKEKYKDINR